MSNVRKAAGFGRTAIVFQEIVMDSARPLEVRGHRRGNGTSTGNGNKWALPLALASNLQVSITRTTGATSADRRGSIDMGDRQGAGDARKKQGFFRRSLFG